jgi:hypothetical protein
MIDFKGDYRLASLSKTIISPAKVGKDFVTLRYNILLFIPLFFKWLTPIIGLNPKSIRRELLTAHREAVAFPLLKSSPFTTSAHHFEDLTKAEMYEAMVKNPVVSTHPLAIHEAANALERSSELREPTHYFLGLLPDNNVMREAFRLCISLPLKRGIQSIINPFLGKLSLKAESAGKVRVFAMVDPWTQWLLKPLHDTIFDYILAGIEQDGTRDQLAPVHTLLRSKPESLFSLDLSAATDRLPLWLQVAILQHVTGEIYAQNWADLLVKRDYVLSLKDNNNDKMVRYPLRYEVGQPMGALSSWAMLALTHHFIVQFAAHRAGHVAWFSGYAILGDDIVIGDTAVAKEYLDIMRSLGVGIGLHKSLISISGSALEFAKKTFFRGKDVSPITLTELQASFNSPASAVGFIRKYSLTLATFVKVAGYGYRVLGQLHKPLGILNSKIRLLVLAMNVPTSPEEVHAFFSLGKPRSGKALLETQAVVNQLVDKELPRIKKALNKIRLKAHSLEGHQLHAKDIADLLLDRVSPMVQLRSEDRELLLDFLNEAKTILNEEPTFTLEGKTFNSSTTDLELALTYEPSLVISKGGRQPEVGLLEALQNVIDSLEEFYLEKGEILDSGEFMGYNYSVTHAAYGRTLLRLMRAQFRVPSQQVVKHLMEMVQGSAHQRILVAGQAISDSLVKLQLGKWDIPMDEMFMGLISISRDIGSLPLSSVQYTRIIDVERQSFTDGTLIRLWKALAGVAQGTLKVESQQPKEFKGWW